MTNLLNELARPFAPEAITWKPGKLANDGARCLAMPYADVRAYMDRLDEVCGLDWSVRYEPWGNERLIAVVTIAGVARSSTGEMDGQDLKNGLGGTASEAQAFKRACAMFGLGRYLYDMPTVWADYDRDRKRFSDKGIAQLDALYRSWLKQHSAAPTSASLSRSTEGPVPAPDDPEPARHDAGKPSARAHHTLTQAQRNRLHALGSQVYGSAWDAERKRLVQAVSKGAIESSNDLTRDQVDVLIAGMEKKLHDQAQAKVAA